MKSGLKNLGSSPLGSIGAAVAGSVFRLERGVLGETAPRHQHPEVGEMTEAVPTFIHSASPRLNFLYAEAYEEVEDWLERSEQVGTFKQ